MASQYPVNVAISGASLNNTLVAAQAGYKIRVLSYVIDAAGSLTARFISSDSVNDTYAASNADATTSLYSGTKVRYGQSFTATFSGLLESMQFTLSKFGAPTGNATAKIYAHSGVLGTSSVPTGGALATSDNFDVSTLATSGALTTLTFSGANRYAIVAGTNYCIELLYSGGDATNYIKIGTDTSTPTHVGNAFYYDGSYTAVAGTDTPFVVNASTYLTGAMSMIAGYPNIADAEREGHFETESGDALALTLSATTQVSGHLTYSLIAA